MNWTQMRSVALAVLGLGAVAAAQPCPPTYGTTFNTGDLNGNVNAIALGDIGSGSEVFVGGEFVFAGGAPRGPNRRLERNGVAHVRRGR
jgi:hypothetical protein